MPANNRKVVERKTKNCYSVGWTAEEENIGRGHCQVSNTNLSGKIGNLFFFFFSAAGYISRGIWRYCEDSGHRSNHFKGLWCGYNQYFFIITMGHIQPCVMWKGSVSRGRTHRKCILWRCSFSSTILGSTAFIIVSVFLTGNFIVFGSPSPHSVCFRQSEKASEKAPSTVSLLSSYKRKQTQIRLATSQCWSTLWSNGYIVRSWWRPKVSKYWSSNWKVVRNMVC